MKENMNLAVFKIHDVKAVLFDLDGTLLDFEKTWCSLLFDIISDVKNKFKLKDEVIEDVIKNLGVEEDGFAHDSVYVSGHFDLIMSKALDSELIDSKTKESMLQYIKQLLDEKHGELAKPHLIPGVKDVILTLKQHGYIVGLVTTDLKDITLNHLVETGLNDVFDCVYSDDGTLPIKPDTKIVDDICRKFNLCPHEIAMVGDTLTDMQFAIDSNMGYAVYVRSGYPNEKAEKMSDMILENVVQLVLSQ